jgi:hypothetical protein
MISDSGAKLYATASDIKKAVDELGLDSASKSLAVKCVEEFYKSFYNSSVTQAGTSFLVNNSDEIHRNLLESADGANMCNHHLERFGLEMREDEDSYDIHVQELVKK